MSGAAASSSTQASDEEETEPFTDAEAEAEAAAAEHTRLVQQRLAEEEARRRAEEEERRADEVWRALQRMQQQRQEEAQVARAKEAEERRAADQQRQRQENARKLQERLRAREAEQKAEAQERESFDKAASAARSHAGSPAVDPNRDVGGGWTAREQVLLQEAMRRYPSYEGDAEWNRRERWAAIAAELPGRSVREVLRRCRQLKAAVERRSGPPLLRLGNDALLELLKLLRGPDLCTVARVCKELGAAAHDEVLWLPFANALPSKWAYDAQDRAGEPPWAFTIRVRTGLFGAWFKLQAHLAGQCPYLEEIGTLQGTRFAPRGGALHHRIAYGAICELVQLELRQQGALNARVYKSVAEQLVSFSADPRSPVPPDLHMTIREIYKTCYPGFGAGTGSGAYSPGLQAGGSSTKAGTSGAMLGKGVATMTKKVADEEMRKRLDTYHNFMCLIKTSTT